MMKRTWKTVQIVVIACIIVLIGSTICFSDSGYAYGETATLTASASLQNAKTILWQPSVYDDTSICMSWSSAVDAEGYEVYRAASKNGTYQKVTTTNGRRNIFYFDKNVKIGKVYYYKVRAYKYSGGKKVCSKFSSKKSIRMTLPISEAKKVSIDSKGKVTCTYEKLKYASGYYIYHSSDGKNFKKVKTVSGNKTSTSFTLKNVPEENYFKIRGYINIGNKRYLGEANPYDYCYSPVVTIKNPVLKKALKNNLGKSSITRKDLKECMSLIFGPDRMNNYKGYDLSKCTLSDFSFLKYCENLTSIDLEECELSDLGIITDNMPDNNKVRELLLASNNLTSLSGIGKFKNLKEVDLSDNDLEQLDGIEECSNLKTISLINNPIRSFSALEKLNKVETILYAYYHRMYRDQPENEPYEYTNYTGYEEICKKLGLPVSKNKPEEVIAEEAMDQFIEKEITLNMNDYEKVKAAHDYIVKAITYGGRSGNHDRLYEALVLGRGVCADYAYAYGMLLARMGFHAEYVSGDDPTGGEGHAWNIVKVDGQYYHVDCTWDDPNDRLRYDYFLKSDKTMRAMRVYTWDTSVYPACPNDYK